MNLRDVYVGLSGKTGISNDGPLHRFANACTRLIDVIDPGAEANSAAMAAALAVFKHGFAPSL
jgi:hypothetical protein